MIAMPLTFKLIGKCHLHATSRLTHGENEYLGYIKIKKQHHCMGGMTGAQLSSED